MDKVYKRVGFVDDGNGTSVDDAYTITIDGEGTRIYYSIELPKELYGIRRIGEVPKDNSYNALRVLVTELTEALRQLELREAQALALTKDITNL
jgi:hypothetical protein